MDAPSVIARRIDADFARPELGQRGIAFIGYREWMQELSGEPGADGDDDLVCVAGGRSFPVSLSRGVEHAIATVAAALQDEVMDHLHRPWPQVGAARLVLEPRLDDAGLAVWSSADGALRCPVGSLTAFLGRLDQVR